MYIRNYERKLLSIFGLEPMEETQALYSTLQSGVSYYGAKAFKKNRCSLNGYRTDVSSMLQDILREEDGQIRIKSLGIAQVSFRGRSIADWDTVSAKQLFYLLLANHQGISSESISDALWSSNEGIGISHEKSRSRVSSTSLRLRQAFGCKEIVIYDKQQKRYLLNPEFSIWWDVEGFREIGKIAEDSEDWRTKVSLYQAAIDLYKGDFLEEFYSDWPIPMREELRDLYICYTRRLGDLFFENDRLKRLLLALGNL